MATPDLEAELRRRARELIDRGALPDEPVAFVWGAYGHNRCSLCEQTIEDTEIEYGLETRIHGAFRNFHLHFLCHAAWQLECARAQSCRRAE